MFSILVRFEEGDNDRILRFRLNHHLVHDRLGIRYFLVDQVDRHHQEDLVDLEKNCLGHRSDQGFQVVQQVQGGLVVLVLREHLVLVRERQTVQGVRYFLIGREVPVGLGVLGEIRHNRCPECFLVVLVLLVVLLVRCFLLVLVALGDNRSRNRWLRVVVQLVHLIRVDHLDLYFRHFLVARPILVVLEVRPFHFRKNIHRRLLGFGLLPKRRRNKLVCRLVELQVGKFVVVAVDRLELQVVDMMELSGPLRSLLHLLCHRQNNLRPEHIHHLLGLAERNSLHV